MPEMPTLLVAAHGTVSSAGSATTAALLNAITAARPDVPAALCFLDVARPRLIETLAAHPEPTVIVPLLLSAGFHVLEDIPAVVSGHPLVRVARHLGPDPLVIEVLVDRLAAVRRTGRVGTTVLVGAGSSHPAGAEDLAYAGQLLATRLGRPVPVLTLGQDVRAALVRAAAPVEVATYLLAPGHFLDNLRAAAVAAGSKVTVAEPIGVHPALVTLVLARYDEVLAAV
ncbi:MAG: sirohydrochlorin chelatase [Jatrophihabitantaceae bacterium]